MNKYINYLWIILVLCTISLNAGDVARKGTTGADQLLIPVGARGIATGGAFVANLTGLESIYYNPAGLDVNHTHEAMFNNMSYLADIQVNYFAVAASLGDLGTLALSFKTLDFGDIELTTFEQPDGVPGRTYSPSFLTTTLTYSKIVTDRISVGANFKAISEQILNTSALGFALDMGVQYRFNEQLSLGAAVKNIGTNMNYAGADLQGNTGIPNGQLGSTGSSGNYEIITEYFQIPSYFDLSLAYRISINEQNYLQSAATFTANSSLEDKFNFGLEYGFMNSFFVRGGYNVMAENTSESIYGFTLGAGVNYEFSEGMGVSFDYAFREVKDFPDPNHVFTVKLALK